jgi:biopolymer transport protein ExbB
MIDFFQKGGPLMYPLLFCSILSLTIIIERLVHLRNARNLNRKSFEVILPLVEGGVINNARQACIRNPGVFTNIILAGLDACSRSREEVKEAILDAGRHEVPQLERRLGILGTIAAVAPLLGLLGTVSGMIKIFQVIATLGVGQADALSQGISEALYTTATGLGVAIPSLVMHNYLREQAETLILDIEKKSIQVVNHLFESSGSRSSPAAPFSGSEKVGEL